MRSLSSWLMTSWWLGGMLARHRGHSCFALRASLMQCRQALCPAAAQPREHTAELLGWLEQM